MTGAEALAYLERRLGEQGLALEGDRTAELLDYLTEGRDEVLRVFADCAPIVVQQVVALTADPDDRTRYTFPDATADPFRVIRVYDTGTDEDLSPANQLNFDNGHYRWDDTRTIRLADSVTLTGSLAVTTALAAGPITADTDGTRTAWGIPTTCHRAAAKYAAILALTADEGSDATAASALYAAEIDKLSRLYGDFDSAGGLALREAFLRSEGEFHGDSLY